MRVATLAFEEHANYIASGSFVAGLRPQGVVRREGGVALLVSGVAMRLFNQVLIEDARRATKAAVADAVKIVRTAPRFVVHLRRGVDERFVRLMGQLGLVRTDAVAVLPGMALEKIEPEPRNVSGLDIRRVTDERSFEEHARTASAAFEIDEALVWSFLDVRMLDNPDATFYVGYADGQPVTTGLGFRTGRTIGVYNIATVASARRRGFGEAMTTRVTADGAEAGCDVAILQASEMGKSLYERLGYRTVVEYLGFSDPSPETGELAAVTPP